MKAIFSLCLLMLGSTMLSAQAEKALDLEHPTYTLKITHAVDHPRVQFPRNPIPLGQYQPTKDEADRTLTFKQEGKVVTIQPGGISGKLQKSTATTLTYQLDQGLFAGGRLVVEKAPLGLQAELTVFGSGVPVIKSMRGALNPLNLRRE